MAVEFLMPKLGLTMEAGTILRWLVDDGTEVAEGTAVLEIETDKVESEVEASASGRLHQLGAVGDTYACGEPIGWFLSEGEGPPAPPPVASASPSAPATASTGSAEPVAAEPAPSRPPSGGRLRASPNARRVAAELGVDLATVVGSGPRGRIVSEDVERAAPTPPAPAPSVVAPAASGSPLATIAARQLADLIGIDLAEVDPAAADGRVTRDDVARHVRARLSASRRPAPSTTPSAAPLTQQPSVEVPLRGMRGTIAARMHESLQTMAQLTLTMDVVMDRVLADREARRAAGAPPGFTDYVIAAAAAALAEHPIVNSQVTDDAVALLPAINVGMAVALDDGLVVPVVREADRRSLDDIAAETTRLADAARNGKLGLPDLEGATFSVTALGMFGVDVFTPIINPPNTAILGVGRIRRTTTWIDDEPAPADLLTLSLTWDHRAFDGVPAARFTQAVRDRLESWGPS